MTGVKTPLDTLQTNGTQQREKQIAVYQNRETSQFKPLEEGTWNQSTQPGPGWLPSKGHTLGLSNYCTSMSG